MSYGDPRLPPRFWSKVEESTDGCWLWTAALNGHGYARFWWPLAGKAVYGHRLAFDVVGPGLTPGLVLDHLCRNRACVNPAHLEEVTLRLNIQRGNAPTMQRHRANTCQNGHDLREGYVMPGGRRRCRTCHKEYMRPRNKARPSRSKAAREARALEAAQRLTAAPAASGCGEGMSE